MSIQRGQVRDLGHGRRPVALQMTHSALDVGLLLRLTNHAETGLTGIVTDQGLKALVELPLSSGEQVRHDRLGIVPPQLLRNTIKEGERFDQALKDGFGTLGR
jgi:hypothetical protein